MKQKEYNEHKLMITTIMIGILLFGLIIITIVILSADIETQLDCTMNGINYDKTIFDEVMNEQHIITNTDYVTQFSLSNATISCKGNLKIPVWMIGKIQ